MGFLNTQNKTECFGCEACVQVCPKSAIVIQEDEEGFRYPIINRKLCVDCGLCHKVCPKENMPSFNKEEKSVFGGYCLDTKTRWRSTSGGAFSVIAELWLQNGGVVFGAASEGLDVFHVSILRIEDLPRICRSKYSQSVIGETYSQAKEYLKQGKKVLFSGTPCQIAGLKAFLNNKSFENLCLVEVICEGIPSPLYIRKFEEWLYKKYGSKLRNLDYRYKGSNESHLKIPFFKWDFEVMQASLQNHHKWEKDRWFNPFWAVWLKHLISRPSCYECPFTNTERTADITLGDLWGVHIYCPELYGNNGGASLVICNSEIGKKVWNEAKNNFYGHELDFQTALKYQGPLRKHIENNPERNTCIQDLKRLDYKAFCKKWATPPTLKLLWQKYVWGNRQKVFLWNLKNKIIKK